MTGMSQLQAVGLVAAFGLAIGVTLGIAILVMTVRYEIEDRLARRRRRAYLRGVARSEAARPAVRRSNGRWAA